MAELIVAVSATAKASLEAQFDERTAGLWRDSIELRELYEERSDKEANNGDLQHLSQRSTAVIVAQQDLTSKWLESDCDIKRMTMPEIKKYVSDWFARKSIGWRDNIEDCREKGAYRWLDLKEWREQFRRVDPIRGLKVASGILAQLKIVSIAEMAEWFDDLPPVDVNAFFIGSDPQSGDYGIINTLSARIPGPELHEASELPTLTKTGSLRIFSDGAWSGGESARRLKCMYTPCANKTNAIGPENRVSMRFAYITDVAERRLDKQADELTISAGLLHRVHFSSPLANRLLVNGEHGSEVGLAFQSLSIRKFVDPANTAAMRELCKTIGEQIAKSRPLGTRGIASTIAFGHSLPKAMLPVLIMSGTVKGADGLDFTWRPLLSSKHVSNPADDTPGYYCATCPLND